MKQNGKRSYTRPTIVSEKVFEQAALACSHQLFNDIVGTPAKLSLKTSTVFCSYSSS